MSEFAQYKLKITARELEDEYKEANNILQN